MKKVAHYAWPGGYPLFYYVESDDGRFHSCPSCVNQNRIGKNVDCCKAYINYEDDTLFTVISGATFTHNNGTILMDSDLDNYQYTVDAVLDVPDTLQVYNFISNIEDGTSTEPRTTAMAGDTGCFFTVKKEGFKANSMIREMAQRRSPETVSALFLPSLS